MRTLFTAISLGFVLYSFGQNLPFNKSAFEKWDEKQRKDRLFGVLEVDSISDEQLAKFLEELVSDQTLDVKLRSRSGRESIFDACVRSEKYAAARVLLVNGYDPNTRCFDCNGETSLHKAVVHSGKREKPSIRLNELLLYMLQNGADPDLRDIKGNTPLHLIIDHNDVEAFGVFMDEKVVFNYQLATLKGLGYLQYFDKKWNEDKYRNMLMDKSGLKYPPTKKEIRKKKKENAKNAKKKKKN